MYGACVHDSMRIDTDARYSYPFNLHLALVSQSRLTLKDLSKEGAMYSRMFTLENFILKDRMTSQLPCSKSVQIPLRDTHRPGLA